MTVIVDKWLTENFRAAEFRCRCRRPLCDAPPMDPAFMAKLQEVRTSWGKPMTITSGSRCEHWNRLVGGRVDSQHLDGNAADIHIDTHEEGVRLEGLADRFAMGGFGLARSFVHFDNGPKGRRWTYGN